MVSFKMEQRTISVDSLFNRPQIDKGSKIFGADCLAKALKKPFAPSLPAHPLGDASGEPQASVMANRGVDLPSRRIFSFVPHFLAISRFALAPIYLSGYDPHPLLR